jgi:glycosyltransferase involved in cell wall biosynthesis
MVSILILTKNEEQDLPDCLDSVSWSDDVHVFDSFSSDNTIHIANQKGARVSQRIFDGYASQRNFAFETLSFKYPWILILDADERIPKKLVEEIQNKIHLVDDSINGFRIRRRDYLDETWLKYSQITPYYIRLIRKGKAKYHREINEVIEVDGLVQDFEGYFNHFPFSKGIKHWIEKHNQYSSMEAIRWIEEHSTEMKFSFTKAFFDSDLSIRRYHQKGLFYKMPGRPIIKWCYMFFVRRAFLDGRAGLTYSILQSIYEYFILLKTNELLKQKEVSKSKPNELI